MTQPKEKCKHEGTFGEIDGIHECVDCSRLLIPPYHKGDEVNDKEAKIWIRGCEEGIKTSLATQKAELRGKIEGMRVGGTTEYWNGYDQALADLLSLLDKQ